MNLKLIWVKGIYFAPRDIKPNLGRIRLIGQALNACRKFHFRQMGSIGVNSKLRWKMRYRPYIGARALPWYQEEDFFKRVTSEVISEVGYPRRGYPVVAVFAEATSVGDELDTAGSPQGSRGHCLIARDIMGGLPGDWAFSVVAHEIYHCLGLMHSDDRSVMGPGCGHGLSRTYLNQKHKDHLAQGLRRFARPLQRS